MNTKNTADADKKAELKALLEMEEAAKKAADNPISEADAKVIDDLIAKAEQPETASETKPEIESENAALKAQISDMQSQMAEMMRTFQAAMLVKNQEITEIKVDTGVTDLEDDRNDEVTVVYNTPSNGFQYVTKPKSQAVQALYEWFRHKKNKNIDHGDIYDKNLDEVIEDVNEFTVYFRLRRRDLATRKYKTVMVQAPCWIAVDRMLQGGDLELISKGEYDRFMEEKMIAERKFNIDYYNRKRLKAMEAIAKIPSDI